MSDYQRQIDNLYLQLEDLIRKQDVFSSEIMDLRLKINALQDLLKAEESKTVLEETKPVEIIAETVVVIEPVIVTPPPVEVTPPVQPAPAQKPAPEIRNVPPVAPANHAANGLEKYIGENLIPVIGIIITVIGVGIGAKYAIDHQLINPLTRILLGYLMGGGLLFFAARFRKKYENFSAILLSGSMAIFYFITYFAYSFYGLIPLPLAFAMMVVFTGFTVYSAIRYNKEIIAHIGLVGAYAVPFLLSDGSGRVGIFFAYMTIINIGILVVSFFRDWKSLYYVAFGLTWFIFLFWFGTGYRTDKHFALAFTFLVVFFLVFYAANLAYKLIKKEVFNEIDVMMILLNSFIFFGLGIAILGTNVKMHDYYGWFTLLNAVIHIAVSLILYAAKIADKSLLALSAGLGIVYATIFIPVQYDGDWIPLLWICEAALLFWIGRRKSVPMYEYFSHPVLLIAFVSLCVSWVKNYLWGYHEIAPFLNVHFLGSCIFAGVLLFMHLFSRKDEYVAAYSKNPGMLYLTNNLVYVVLLIVLFFGVQLEISHYWKDMYNQSIQMALNKDYFMEPGDAVMRSMGTICRTLYLLLFLSGLAFFNAKRKISEEFKLIFFISFLFSILAFLTLGLYQLNFLQLKYLWEKESDLFYHGFWLVGVRYFAYAVMALAVFQLTRFVKKQMPSKGMGIVSEYILHTVVVWCISAELVNWMHSINSDQAYKLVLSIFAGLYALFMIVLGIWKRKSYLRIGAISLFGITLFKLFFYDISQLNTIFKTVIFISLGILLLIIAFLYNRYKGRMFDEE